MVRVKVCGIRTPEEAAAAVAAGADFLGVVFATSRRRVTIEEAQAVVATVRELQGASHRQLLPSLPPASGAAASRLRAWAGVLEEALRQRRPLVVGVFADQTAEEVNRTAEAAGIDLVQLSGGEADDEALRFVRWPVIRALHVGDDTAPERLLERALATRAAAVLLDTADLHHRGGTGRPFAWEKAAPLARTIPLLLAGGLTPETVGAAVAAVGPWGVDVSSGVERDGRKDPERIAAFVSAAKGARG